MAKLKKKLFLLFLDVKVSEPVAPNLSCPPKGLVDIGLCKFGAPLSLSWPHFYKADKKIREGVEGEKKFRLRQWSQCFTVR